MARSDKSTTPFDSPMNDFSDFMDRYADDPEMLAQLRAFLEARPDWSEPKDITVIKEYDDRYAFIKDVANTLNNPDKIYDRDWKMTVPVLAAVMLGPIDELRHNQEQSPDSEFAKSLQAVRPSLLHFFRDAHMDTIPPPIGTTPLGPASAICRARDGFQCIVTRCCDAVACDIVPSFWSRSTTDVSNTEWYTGLAFGVFLGRERRDKLRQLLNGGQGCLEYSWNKILLSRELRDFWSRALWAFRYRGTSQSEGKWKVTIQFHWMPQDSSRQLHQKNVLDCNENPFSKLEPNTDAIALNAETHRPIRTGDIFVITLPTAEEAEKFKLMIKIQWTFIRIAALSGVAGNPKILDCDDVGDLDPGAALEPTSTHDIGSDEEED